MTKTKGPTTNDIVRQSVFEPASVRIHLSPQKAGVAFGDELLGALSFFHSIGARLAIIDLSMYACKDLHEEELTKACSWATQAGMHLIIVHKDAGIPEWLKRLASDNVSLCTSSKKARDLQLIHSSKGWERMMEAIWG